MYEPFRETPVYKEMTKFIREEAFEEGREEAREEAREGALKAIQEGLKRIEEERQRIEEERQKRLQDNRQTLINLVQKLFPSLAVLARKQAESITEPFVLQVMITKTFSVQTLEEAIQCLIEVPDAIEKHD